MTIVKSTEFTNKTEKFSANEYLRTNQDVKKAGVDPYTHWEKYGKNEKRILSFKEEFSSFENDGYIVIREGISTHIVDSALKKIENFKQDNLEMWNRNTDSNGFVRRVTNLHLLDEAIQNLFSENLAARFCDYAFEESTCTYTSLFFEAGSEQPIHRDTPYFHTKPVNKFFGFWVALEDVTLFNGPLKLIPTGHKSSEQNLEEIGKMHFSNLEDIDPNSKELWDEYQKAMHNQCIAENLKEIQIEIKKGDTLVWHPMLPHGGSAIKNPKLTRRSIVFHVTPLNTPVYQQDAFFNPNKELNDSPVWPYRAVGDRHIALTGNSVQFPGYFDGKRDEVRVV